MKDHFFDEAGDARMEEQNRRHWKTLVERIREVGIPQDSLPPPPWDILDIGCHTGGLMKMFADSMYEWIKTLNGVEPIDAIRERLQPEFALPVDKLFASLAEVPDASMDVVVSHEVLYLVKDLNTWMREFKRILRPQGAAFVALGSHGDNTAWLRWRLRLRNLHGHESYIHQPVEILQAGEDAGFDMEIARLHREPLHSLRYTPPQDGWGEFHSAEEMFNFYNEWKLLFTFYPKQ